jgi:parvulin-like peptidyl-prolyl isomerase
MKVLRVMLAALGALLLLAAAGCGGGDEAVPSGAVALVDGTEVTRAELDSLVAQAKRSYEAQKQEFPKVGSPEYQSIQTQYVAFLVQRTQFEQAAEDLGVAITDGDIDKGVQDFIKERFNGKRKDFEKALKQQDFSEEAFRKTISVSVLSKKIYDAVTKDVKVTDAEVRANYTENIATYQTPESREVRHILIAEKGSNGQVDYAASKQRANDVYSQLKDGADFASLVQRYSTDTQSKPSGGKLTISRGQTVPEFDKKAFELKTDEISQPVKTTYGYHIIQALADVKPAKTTPFEQVKETIRANLVQQKKQDVMNDWVDDLNKQYEDKISYAAGFEPPDIPSTPTETE